MAAEREDPIAALIDAAATVGIEVVETSSVIGSQAVLVIPDGARIPIAVKRLSLASADGLLRRLEKWERRLTDPHAIRMVVADRVTNEARELIRGLGWSWLDLRGHLHLSAPGLFVDSDVAMVKGRGQRTSPFSGRGGVEVAVELLLDPHVSQGIRRIADRIGRAPSTVSEVMSSLRASNLVDGERRPQLPELFWELAAEWRPASANVASLPARDSRDALQVALCDPQAYGAQIGADHPAFYVPDDATLQRAVRLLGQADDQVAATIRVAPVAAICSRTVESEGLPLAQPLFVALDLAQDPSRGREMLRDWTPPEPWHRVW